MTVGLNVVQANAILGLFRGTGVTAPTGMFVKLHVGDPGAAGTLNPSVVTTRNPVTFAVPVAGVMAMSALASYSMTATETISHVSLWDAATVGTFWQSGALTTPIPVASGSTLVFASLSCAYSPVAA